ncbi:MAG: protein-export chaperone SecB [Pseudomonadota bacterium]
MAKDTKAKSGAAKATAAKTAKKADGNASAQPAPAAAPQAAAPQGADPAATAAGPQISVLGQFVKDLSFEAPNPAAAIQKLQGQAPQMNVSVNVGGKQIGEGQYEVDLSIEARAGEGDSTIFQLELVYTGFMQVTNTPAEQIHPVVFIEGPRLLFPFARQIVAETTGHGGISPVLLQPMDFVGLYRHRVAQMGQGGAAAAGQA